MVGEASLRDGRIVKTIIGETLIVEWITTTSRKVAWTKAVGEWTKATTVAKVTDMRNEEVITAAVVVTTTEEATTMTEETDKVSAVITTKVNDVILTKVNDVIITKVNVANTSMTGDVVPVLPPTALLASAPIGTVGGTPLLTTSDR
jgi:hypothetical protein